jgi:hypothetical protein
MPHRAVAGDAGSVGERAGDLVEQRIDDTLGRGIVPQDLADALQRQRPSARSTISRWRANSPILSIMTRPQRPPLRESQASRVEMSTQAMFQVGFWTPRISLVPQGKNLACWQFRLESVTCVTELSCRLNR